MNTEEIKGLTSAEVEQSRKKWGENVLTPPAKPSVWRQFLEKLDDPMIKILLVALLLSVAFRVPYSWSIPGSIVRSVQSSSFSRAFAAG